MIVETFCCGKKKKKTVIQLNDLCKSVVSLVFKFSKILCVRFKVFVQQSIPTAVFTMESFSVF